MTDDQSIDQRGQTIHGSQTNIAKADKVIIQESAKSTPPLIPHQIPPPPQDFTGREDDIREILASFDRGATITGLRGMGGIGKTALALVLAERLQDRFPDGQIFVDLRGTSDKPLTLAEAMAHVIRAYHPDVKMPENENELQGLYYSVISGKSALLLLDNARDRDHVEPLLPPAGSAVLITSRQRFTLPGLKARDLNILPPDDAKKLLLAICDRIGDQADELARLCGYLPLALRNAASVLAERISLGVAEYLQRLKDARKRLDLVEASFSLSYELLAHELQERWALLSVFPTDFDRAGAGAVWMRDLDSTTDALSDLVRWSLVDFIPAGERYRLHDLAKVFADSRLKSDARAPAQQRHAEHYLKVLAVANSLYLQGGDGILAGLNLFDHEEENIRAGQAWSEENFGESSSATGLCKSYPGVGAYVLDLRLHPQEKIRWLKKGIDAARCSEDKAAEGTHLGNLALAYADLGESRKAIEYYEQALEISCQIGDRRGKEADLGNLGLAYACLGEPRKAIEYYEQALKISREIGNRGGEEVWLGNLGTAYASLDNARKAIEYYEQALAIACEIGDRRGEGTGFGSLGAAYASLGEPRKAIEHYKQALVIAHETGDRRGEGAHLSNMGSAYYVLGDARKAIEYYDQALAIAREIGDKRGEGNALFNMSLSLDKLGQRVQAIERASAALRIFEEIESPHAEAVRRKLAEWQE